MSTNSQGNIEDQEIDMAMISKKIGGFFQHLNRFIFDCIQFVLKHLIVIGILLVIGIGVGLYLDKTQKTYDHEIVVAPNFGSADYLYSKIALLHSKIKERDTMALRSIGILEPSKLTDIEIKPIIDIYQFINNNNDRNFELLKLMAENSDIKKILEETPTAKNYKYHVISFKTKNMTSKSKTVDPILKFLNSSNYYSEIQKEYVANIHIKMKANEVVINQVDNFLNGFAQSGPAGKSDKLVYYNENSPLNDVIETKDRLVQEQGNLRINLVSMDKIIKEISQTTNVENNKATNGKLKIVLPLVLVGIYLLFYFFVNFYKKQSLIRQQQS